MTANRDHLTRLYLNGAVALLDHLLAAERKADNSPVTLACRPRP